MSRQAITVERLIFLFLLGALLFNPPMLSIFNVPDYLFGVPLLYLYVFACWGGLLLVLALVIERARDGVEGEEPRGEHESGRKGPASGGGAG